MKKSFKVGLISPYSNLSAIGLRYISASLQAAGWTTWLIVLPDQPLKIVTVQGILND